MKAIESSDTVERPFEQVLAQDQVAEEARSTPLFSSDKKEVNQQTPRLGSTGEKVTDDESKRVDDEPDFSA